MKSSFKNSTIALILTGAAFCGLTACHKTPIKNNPMPVPPTPVSIDGWKKVSGLPSDQIQVLEVANNTLYAASASGIVYSTADGANWATSSAVQPADVITALAVFKNKLYAGTQSKGIFTSADAGKTWTNTAANFPEVSSFAQLNDTLYSSSGAYSGIVALDESSSTWLPFDKNGLPTNYNLDVQKILPVNNTLVSVQGENGNYYLFAEKAKYWSEEYFFKSYTPGLRVSDMIYDNGTLYAGYDIAILSSQDAGADWSYDTVGLRRGGDALGQRSIYAGMDYYYTIHDAGNEETWVQKRRRDMPGTSWATAEEHLAIGYSYSIREFNGMLFLATDNGIYFKSLTT